VETLHIEENRRNVPVPELTEWEIEWRKKNEERERKQAAEHARELEIFTSHIEAIRDGEQRYLLGILCSRAERDGNQLGIDLEGTRKEFGPQIADATAAGLKICWRNCRPPFQFEEVSRRSISGDVHIGLAGLQLDFADGLDPSQLNDAEIEFPRQR
jgi:hypothetical protein